MMRIALVSVGVVSLALVPPCRVPSVASRSLPRTRMVLNREGEPTPLLKEISGNNVEMTDSMRAYVETKVGSTVERYQSLISHCDAHLKVTRNPRAAATSDSCEVVVYAKDAVIRVEESASSMYAAIDLVAHKLNRKLRKLKERRQARYAAGKASVRDAALDDVVDDDDDDDDIVPTP